MTTLKHLHVWLVVALSVAAVVMLGPCVRTGPPDGSQITQEQIRSFHRLTDALQEEVAAARAPDNGAFALFVLSLLVPLLAVLWLLFRAERSQIGHDQVVRQMVRMGYQDEVIGAYLQQESRRPALPGPSAVNKPPLHLAHPRSRRRRRLWRPRYGSDDPNPTKRQPHVEEAQSLEDIDNRIEGVFSCSN